jgi:ADP-ribose pyrophosphatase
MNERDPAPWPVTGEEDRGDFEIFRARALHVRDPEGGGAHTFHVADARDGAVVLATTPDERLVLVRQWRHPVQAVTLEPPSGIMDAGEAAEAAAVRELREETGYAGEGAERIGTLVLNPSWQTTRLHVVRIRGAVPFGTKDLDPGEETRVCTVTMADAVRMARDGRIDSASAVAALALLDWSERG